MTQALHDVGLESEAMKDIGQHKFGQAHVSIACRLWPIPCYERE